jgi:hypothetical protein
MIFMETLTHTGFRGDVVLAIAAFKTKTSSRLDNQKNRTRKTRRSISFNLVVLEEERQERLGTGLCSNLFRVLVVSWLVLLLRVQIPYRYDKKQELTHHSHHHHHINKTTVRTTMARRIDSDRLLQHKKTQYRTAVAIQDSSSNSNSNSNTERDRNFQQEARSNGNGRRWRRLTWGTTINASS